MVLPTEGDVSQSTSAGATAMAHPMVMLLIYGFAGSRVVQVAAELGIADLMADGAKSAESLAAQTQTHQPSLHRLLRALASLGLIDEVEDGWFALASLGGQLLRNDVPGSLRHLAMMFGSEHWRCWGDLPHSVRTGQTAMQHIHDMGIFEFLATHPEEATIFNQAMADMTRQIARALVAAYDFSQFKIIVDVGGGNGTLIAAILKAAPALRGIVFDLPSGNVEAARQLAAAGLAERCQVTCGDFFHSVPGDGDTYLLKSIIHDWDDERGILILKNCRKAMAANGKLLLVERVMPARIEATRNHQWVAMLDMNMLVTTGGRERTEAEFAALFAAAGFRLERALPLPDTVGVHLLEGVPS
jgi:SAM-dependent methyltransferase